MPITNEAKAMSGELKINLEKLNHLDFMLNKWVEDGVKERFVINVMRHGVPIFQGTYGDLGHDDMPLQMDTIYPVASNTKPIIAALLLILQEEGKLDLADSASQYLGDYIGEGREKIAIWHFLTHTSGINDDDFSPFIREYIKEKFDIEINNNLEHDEWVKVMLDVHKKMELPAGEDDDDSAHIVWQKLSSFMPLKREPRKHMFYCNFGYQKCKEIITAVTGETIDSYASRKIFEPLGMVDSHFILPKEKWERVVGRSEKAWGYPWQLSPGCFVSESGSGGLKTTAIDILKFAEMIRNDGKHEGKQIMSRFSINEMKTNQNMDLPNSWDSWTMGFNYRGTKKDDTGNLRSPGTLDHGGFAGSKFVIDPEQGLSYAIYTVDIVNQGYNINGRFTNILYSALMD